MTQAKPKKVSSFTMLVGQVIRQKGAKFDFNLDGVARLDGAEQLKIVKISKLHFRGTITPLGAKDWQMEATLGASIVQECVVSLTPVKTRISESITRHFITGEHGSRVESPEQVEMDGNTETDPTPDVFDFVQIALEAVALTMPDYPRAEGAVLQNTLQNPPESHSESSMEPEKPFAKLAKLKDKLENNANNGD